MNLVLLIACGITCSLIITFVIIYNRLIKARNLAQTALSDIDVHLTKRFSIVPNLVALTKNYVQYESALLLEIVEKRAGKISENIEKTASEDSTVTTSLDKIRIVAENYPELKANQQFLRLMEELALIEDDLLYARRFYNGAVRDLNNKTQSFPNTLVAGMFGFHLLPFYRVNDETERNAPAIH